MLVLVFLIDLILTIGIAILTSWYFTSRYLASRSPTRLGKNDVATLRSMRDELMMLLMLDEQGVWLMPERNRDHIRVLVSRHDNQKELPE